MTDPIATFFSAWEVAADAPRLSLIASAVSDGVRYDDPRTPQSLMSIAELSEYVGHFSAGAPGWSARVVGSDAIGGVTRATVAFEGPGPDGAQVTQLGQYFIETDGERITRMVGFAGVGPTEA